MISRRGFLRATLMTAGAGGVGLLSRAADQGVFGVARGSAYALWDTWDRGGGMEPVVAAGLLAANAHNAQPWRFRVNTGSKIIDVLRDPERNIGAIDPFRREMHMSLGCAIENIALTARASGHQPRVTLLPDGEPDLMARIDLGPSGTVDPAARRLADVIDRRHTNRHPFADTTVTSEVLQTLRDQVTHFDGVSVRWLMGEDFAEFRDGTWEATKALTEDTQMSADSHAWQRHSWTDMQQEAAGLTYDGALSNPLAAAAVKALPDLGESAANKGFLTTMRMQLDTAPLAALLVAEPALAEDPTAAPQAWLRAGQVWQHLHLAITADGLVAQPLNQLAELADRERQLGRPSRFGDTLATLAGPGKVPMMPFRLGYPTRTATPTPRRPLTRVVSYT